MNDPETNSPGSAGGSPIPSGDSPTEAVGSSELPLPPPRIPDHELIRPIGRGAYGEVWIARSVTGAYRAVKIVRRSSFDHARPFEREFEGIQKFEPISRTHDSQVDILHVGRGEDYFYYVMELADDQATGGQINPDNYHPRTLKSDLLFHGHLPFEECVSIGIALTTALQHLHRNGLVHRDVKPSNIIFVNGVAKLADIGLVTGVDTTRSYVGTEGFAAPEGPGTAQADLFSLGKVLYEMSTGKDRQEFPELPTNLRELPEREGLVELNAVIAKACRHDPGDRYANASAMRADLELLQSGKSLARLHRIERSLRVVRRAGAVATALALIAVTAFWFQARQTKQARDLAKQNLRLAAENRQRVVQLDTANGLRSIEDGDLGHAMVWFADALKYATNDPAQAEMHRMRLSMLLEMHPKPLAIIPASSRTNGVPIELKVDRAGRRLLVNTGYRVELWELSIPPQRLAYAPGTETTNWTDSWNECVISSDGTRFVVGDENPGAAYLWTVKSSNDVQVTSLEAQPVRDLSFIDDDRFILCLSSNRFVKVIDGHSGRVVRSIAEFEMPVARLRVSGNSQRVAVRLTNQVVRVIELTTGAPAGEFNLGENEELQFLDATGRFAVSSRAKSVGRFASGSAPPSSEFQAQIWDLSARRPIGQPLAHENFIWKTIASRDGGKVATASADKTTRVWNQFTGDAISLPLKHAGAIAALAFSPDSARIATGDGSGNIQVWENATGQPLTPRLRHGPRCVDVVFAREGAVLVTGSTDGTIRLWDVASVGAPVMTLDTDGGTRGVPFSPDGKFLLVISDPSYLLRGRDGSVALTWDHMPFDRPAFKFSPDSHFIAVLEGRPRRANVWSLQTGTPAGPPFSNNSNSVMDVSFSPDGGTLATAERNKVRLWDWREGRQNGDPLEHTGRVMSVLFSPRGDRMLTTVSNDDRLQPWLWDTERRAIIVAGKAAKSREMMPVPVFSPDGSKWLMPEYPGTIQIVSASDGSALLPTPLHHGNTITFMTFSPDGKRVVTGGEDGVAQAWDSESGRPVSPPLLHNGIVVQCDFSQDSRLIATRTDAGSVRLWDAMTGLPMGPSLQFDGRRSALSPDGRMISMATPERKVVLVNLHSSAPAEQLEDLIRLSTGATVSADGALRKLDRNELLDLYDRTRRRRPEQFRISYEQLSCWHEGQIRESGHLNNLESSLFHLRRLLELQPTNSAVRQRFSRLLARRIPARDPAAPARLIDLTDYYTRSFETLVSREFHDLPRGVHRLAGTDFDLRGLVVLDHAAPWRIGVPGEFPQISHIRVAQRCRRLQFLQAYHGRNAPDALECCRFIIHYADGSQRTQPMMYGRHLSSWRFYRGTPKPVTEAVVAWESRVEGSSEPSFLYKATWENPTPEVEITHLEFRIGKASERPILVAITAE